MKILFVNEKCGFFGGVEQNIADSVQGLSSRGHTFYLAYGETSSRDPKAYKAFFADTFLCREMAGTPQQNGAKSLDDIVKHVVPDGIYFHKIPQLRSFMHLLPGFHTVRMVHDHDICCPRRHKYFITSGRVCRHKLGWRCWLDGAFIERNPSSKGGVSFVNIGHKRREMRRNYRLDALLVGSRFMREELFQNGFPKEKVHILPPVIRMENKTPSPVPGNANILYVGQLIRGKGVDLFLHALKALSCDFRADIIGTGNAEIELKGLCKKLDLETKVNFLGWVRNTDLGAFYSKARAVVVPSRWPEPFGMIGLEAMRHGRPVVAFDVGGIPDWLDHMRTGILVPEQDVGAFGNAISRILLDHNFAEELGQNGLRRVRERYAFEDYLDGLEGYLGAV